MKGIFTRLLFWMVWTEGLAFSVFWAYFFLADLMFGSYSLSLNRLNRAVGILFFPLWILLLLAGWFYLYKLVRFYCGIKAAEVEVSIAAQKKLLATIGLWAILNSIFVLAELFVVGGLTDFFFVEMSLAAIVFISSTVIVLRYSTPSHAKFIIGLLSLAVSLIFLSIIILAMTAAF